ncbi:hypothetical protein SLA2020_389370 [Shorea laevis]
MLCGEPIEVEHVNQHSSEMLPNAFIACHLSCSDIITHPAGSSQSLLPPTLTSEQQTPPLNAITTGEDASLSDQALEVSNSSDQFVGLQQTSFPIQIGSEMSTMDVELDLILSE